MQIGIAVAYVEDLAVGPFRAVTYRAHEPDDPSLLQQQQSSG
jgi:hypothetical protein